MIEDTVGKIERAIHLAQEADPQHKDDLIRLLEQLKTEVLSVPASHVENARSIGHFVEAAAHEATRQEKSAKLLDISRDGLKESAVGFEISHPKLATVVNEICSLLAGSGI